ncbi:hypothetical protein G6F31_017114 [Rhizopus arrhizus]|nr:hypothetical protein G6F31_017114 [Rhizopus arrhizus]
MRWPASNSSLRVTEIIACSARRRGKSWNAYVFVGLQTKPPLRVLHTVLDGLFGIGHASRSVHGLQEEMLEIQMREGFGQRIGLRVDQLQFVAAFDDDGRGALGADADPVDAGRRLDGAVGLDRHGEAAGMDGRQQRRVQLQQGFAAGPPWRTCRRLRRRCR